MKSIILFSLGLMMLLLALSCDAARWRRRPSRRPIWPAKKCTGKGVRYDKCGQRCLCNRGRLSYCVRIRKEFISMTPEDRERYIATVKIASTHPDYKTDYENLLAIHRTLFFGDIHQKKFFLTWHRWFSLQYENLLRRVDCKVTVPYWDWSSSNPFDTSSDGVWNSEVFGFGGNGTGDSSCVQMGPFKECAWSIVPPHNDPEIPSNCLARKFGSLPTEADVQDLLNTPAADFTDFEMKLRAVLHFNVHMGVGGTMFTFNSAAAPEFFLVHGFVDKLWDDWQKKSEEHKNAFFPTVTEKMPETEIEPEEVIDLSSLPDGVRVKYESNAFKLRRGLSLSERPRISRELDPKIIEMFNVQPDEVERANEMEQEAKQMPLTSRGLNKREEMAKLVEPRKNPYHHN